MKETLANLKVHADRILAWWAELPPSRRLRLAAVGVASMAALSGFVWWMSHAEYAPLYAGLTEAEAGVAAARLAQLEVPYRLAESGRTILVPRDRVDQVRLTLAAEGLPSTGRLGFEIFDDASFGATEFAEQVKFRRALEGELERTIGTLDEVRRARVHISLPQRSVFLDDEEPAKASIVLELEPGRIADPETVRAVERLTASAVEGLEPERVAVLDSQGRLFSRADRLDGELTHQQLEFRRKLEQDTVRKIVETLEPYLGPGGVRANVAVDVDWDAGEQTEEVLDPEPVALATQVSEESSFDEPPGGAPGAEANLPRQGAEIEERRGGMRRTMQTTNYQTSRTVTKLQIERGAVKRMSVAVLVDYRQEVDEEARKLVRVPRDESALETIRELVTAASGAMAERGDTVTVASLPFHILEPPLEPPPPPPDPADEILSLEWAHKYRLHILAGLVVIVLLFGAYQLYRRRRRMAKVRAERDAALAAERERKELEEAQEIELQKRAEEEERLLKGLKLAPVQTSKTQILKKHLEEVAENDAESFARLLKAWIHEDD